MGFVADNVALGVGFSEGTSLFHLSLSFRQDSIFRFLSFTTDVR